MEKGRIFKIVRNWVVRLWKFVRPKGKAQWIIAVTIIVVPVLVLVHPAFWWEVLKEVIAFWERANDKTLFGVICVGFLALSVWAVNRIHSGGPSMTETIRQGWKSALEWLRASIPVLIVWIIVFFFYAFFVAIPKMYESKSKDVTNLAKASNEMRGDWTQSPMYRELTNQAAVERKERRQAEEERNQARSGWRSAITNTSPTTLDLSSIIDSYIATQKQTLSRTTNITQKLKIVGEIKQAEDRKFLNGRMEHVAPFHGIAEKYLGIRIMSLLNSNCANKATINIPTMEMMAKSMGQDRLILTGTNCAFTLAYSWSGASVEITIDGEALKPIWMKFKLNGTAFESNLSISNVSMISTNCLMADIPDCMARIDDVLLLAKQYLGEELK